MGTHLDLVQRAVVLSVAVVSALGHGAGDALVCVTAHVHFLLLLDSPVVCPAKESLFGNCKTGLFVVSSG